MNIEPIRNDRLSDKVVESILNMIKDGTLKAGSKLPNETLLAEQFGVSRGILREALTLLQSQGYIRRKPKDGTYVQPEVHNMLMSQSVSDVLKKATYSDLLEFRGALEQIVVEKAIDKATDEELDELMEILTVQNDAEVPRSVDYYFHYKLAEVSKNIFYMNFIDTYYDLIAEIADRSQKDEVRRTQIEQEHLQIATALVNRDKKAAVKSIKHHLSMVDKSIK